LKGFQQKKITPRAGLGGRPERAVGTRAAWEFPLCREHLLNGMTHIMRNEP
jgi:hypothetical protein